VITQVPSGRLNSVELSLVEHVGRGERLDLAPGDEAIDEAAMRSWGDSRTCRASVIRDILCGRLAADPDPHGLRLRGAKITGRLDLENVITDINLELEGCLLEEGVLAADARLRAFGLEACQIEHPAAEPPLDGTRLTCSVLSLGRARVIGHAKPGAVRLGSAHIGGQLNCTGAKLRNASGPALIADGLEVDQGMFLLGRFTAVGAGDLGAVRLVGARIGGNFECDGAMICNASGPALFADRLHVAGGMYLRSGFAAIGSGADGAVNLLGARIGGNFECIKADLWNASGPALMAESLEVGKGMYLVLFTATGGGENAAVNLTSARAGGMFIFDPTRLKHKTDSHRRLAVDGLTYAGVPERISPQGWRELLRQGTSDYAAQPYQQLAAGYRARGHDRQTRRTLMAQRDDQLARTRPRWPEKLWGKITKITLGYGYQPWKALLFLAVVVAASGVLAWLLGAHGALAQTSKTATPNRPCTVVQQISVGLDLNLPVGTSVARVDCDLTKHSDSVTAAWLSAVGWVLRLLAWAFAALFIAGFTSAVRKT
jgi:hypothetical protein